MKYYIIAGEPSADLHGANLIKGIIQSDPKAQIRFWGGELMQQQAGERGTLVKHYKENSIMGFLEVVKNLGKILNLIKFGKSDILQFKPDVLILIDYPGFNLKMAAFAKQNNIKTAYYIAPKVWAWKKGRIKTIRKVVDDLYVIFPFEVEFFEKYGIKAIYKGNPLMDSIEQSKEQFSQYESPKPIIALVAGSRVMEVKHILPVMARTMKLLPQYQGVVTAVDWLDKSLYENILKGTDIKIAYNQTTDVLMSAEAALVKSGTATLETALLGVPQVVCYAGGAVSVAIARKVLKIKWISLVNIILDRTAVTELIQQELTPQKCLSELQRIMPGGSGLPKLQQDYQELIETVGQSGASERVAQDIVAKLN